MEDIPAGAYVSSDEARLLAAKLASARAAQLVVITQAAEQSGSLFAGHDWRSRFANFHSCWCRACIISRAEDTFDELGELVNY